MVIRWIRIICGKSVSGLQFRLSCHSPHFAKNSEIKSISKTRLPFEICIAQGIMSTDDFKKLHLIDFTAGIHESSNLWSP